MRRSVARRAAEGLAVVAALLAPPLAMVAVLQAHVVPSAHLAIVALVGVGAVAWAVVVVGVGRLVLDVLRGSGSLDDVGPLGWAAVRVAALILVAAPFLEVAGAAGTAAAATTARSPVAAPAAPRGSAPRHLPNGGHRGRAGAVAPASVGSGSLLVALAAAARRSRRLEASLQISDDAAIDVETALLGSLEPPQPGLAAVAQALAADGLLGACRHVVIEHGEARLDDETWRFDPEATRADARCLVVVLGESGPATHLALVPRGGVLALAGAGSAEMVADALRVAGAVGLGDPVVASPEGLLRALAVREDSELVVCVDEMPGLDDELAARCVVVATRSASPLARFDGSEVVLADGRRLTPCSLSAAARTVLDGGYDVEGPSRPLPERIDLTEVAIPGGDVAVVRLLTALPRVDGLAEPLDSARERRGVELVAYLATHAGEPVTGERLRVRVLGTADADAAQKTLFNLATHVRRALGDGRDGPRLPPAGRMGRYAVSSEVVCDVSVFEARVARARRCADPEERVAWLRGALELVESEPFAAVLSGYDWFLTEGHLSRLQMTCEDATCELVELCVERGLLALAAWAIDRGRLLVPHAEGLAIASARLARARQASFEAMAPAERSTLPSAPAVK